MAMSSWVRSVGARRAGALAARTLGAPTMAAPRAVPTGRVLCAVAGPPRRMLTTPPSAGVCCNDSTRPLRGPSVSSAPTAARLPTLEELRRYPDTKELHSEVKLLGRVLAETIRNSEGQASLDLVEDTVRKAKAWRRALRAVADAKAELARITEEPAAAGAGADAREAAVTACDAAEAAAAKELRALTAFVGSFSADDTVLVARAFSHYLQLANAAEQNHRVRVAHRRRIANKERVEDMDYNIRAALQAGASHADVLGALASSEIELVLTAHPTEVNRRALLMKHGHVQQVLRALSPPEAPDPDTYEVHDEPARPHLTTLEQKQLLRALRRTVAESWSTDEVHREKPTPQDEARAGLFVIEHSLWEAVPQVMRRVDEAARQAVAGASDGADAEGAGSASEAGAPLWLPDGVRPGDISMLRFGSWMGGDRDGNHFVTPDVTREVTLLSRWMALRLLLKDVEALRYALTMSHADEQVEAAARIIHGTNKGADASHAAVGEDDVPVRVSEPYRVVLQRLVDRLEATLRTVENMLQALELAPEARGCPDDSGFGAMMHRKRRSSGCDGDGDDSHTTVRRADGSGTDVILSPGALAAIDSSPVWHRDDILEPLQLVYDSLNSTSYHAIANGPLLDTIRRVASFGVTFARLDLRQESSRHTEAVDRITRDLELPTAYADMNEDERCEFLLAELLSKRPLLPRGFEASLQADATDAASARVLDTLGTFRAAAEVGSEALGVYIISMAHTPSDVLAVYLLQRECGIDEDSLVPVVPLFETLADLEAASTTIEKLLAFPAYKALVQRMDGQHVMIGYSDSSKDAGRLAAAWAIYKAQEDLVKVCESAEVRLKLFHGKGGTVSRGGGTAGRGAYRAVLAQPRGTVGGFFRATEQGEMIQLQFGSPALAQSTLETYASAVLMERVASGTRDAAREVDPQWRAMMDKLAKASVGAYRRVVDDTKGDANVFVQYFEEATPGRELPDLNIGSRPARRAKTGGSISTLRAIPWVFSWTQVRANLTVWLGLGQALSDAVKNVDDLRCLRCMYEHWPFFHELISLVEMVLAKSESDIWRLYDTLLVPAHPHYAEMMALSEELRGKLEEASAAVLAVSGHEHLAQGNRVLEGSLATRNAYVDPLSVVQVEVLRRLRRQEYKNSDPGNFAHTDDEEKRKLQDALKITMTGIANGLKNTG